MSDNGIFSGGLAGWFDLKLERAAGNIPGEEPWDKYGRITSINSADGVHDVWNGRGTYTGFPTGAAETMEIYSSDDNDTLLGSGAKAVTIYNLLDSTGALCPDITVTLLGQTKVSLGPKKYYRGGSRIRVISGTSNAGTITLRHTTTTANIFAVMPVGRNQTAIGCYTVPLGKTLYIERMFWPLSRANGAAGSGELTLRARKHGEVFNAIVSPEISNSAPYLFENNGYFKFDARTDIKIRVEDVSDNGTTIAGEMNGVLRDD